MRFTFSIKENKQEIQNKILKALLPDCKKFMNSAIGVIKTDLPGLLYTSLTNRPEYFSLISGNLRLELGIPDASSKVQSIINIWISNIEYDYSKPTISGGKIISSFSAKFVKTDFSDVISSEEAYVIDGEYNLPWLKWLLLDGSATIVPRHDVVFGPNPNSRTGDAVMRPSSKGWGVPSDYAGTASDNWITRAIADSQSDIEQLLARALS